MSVPGLLGREVGVQSSGVSGVSVPWEARPAGRWPESLVETGVGGSGSWTGAVGGPRQGRARSLGPTRREAGRGANLGRSDERVHREVSGEREGGVPRGRAGGRGVGLRELWGSGVVTRSVGGRTEKMGRTNRWERRVPGSPGGDRWGVTPWGGESGGRLAGGLPRKEPPFGWHCRCGVDLARSALAAGGRGVGRGVPDGVADGGGVWGPWRTRR